MPTMEAIRQQRPKVGDHRMEHPTVDENTGHLACLHKALHCVVIFVQPEHLWYTVRFDNGLRESYKVPHGDLYKGGGYHVR